MLGQKTKAGRRQGQPKTPTAMSKHDVKSILAAIGLVVMADALAAGVVAAQRVPLPRPRPFIEGEAVPANPDISTPSACRLRLTSARAVAPSMASIDGPAECGGEDLVRLEAVILSNKGNR